MRERFISFIHFLLFLFIRNLVKLCHLLDNVNNDLLRPKIYKFTYDLLMYVNVNKIWQNLLEKNKQTNKQDF